MPYQVDLKRPDLKGQFPCSVCSKVFCHSSSLSRHMMHQHFRNYVCKICCTNIENTDDLRTHMAESHQITSKLVICRCCNWAFADKTTLHMHIQSLQQQGVHDDGILVLATSAIEKNSSKVQPSTMDGQLSPPDSTSQNSFGSIKDEVSSDGYESATSSPQNSFNFMSPTLSQQNALMELFAKAMRERNVAVAASGSAAGRHDVELQSLQPTPQAYFANAMWMAHFMRNNAIAAQQVAAAAKQAQKRKAEVGELSVDTALSEEPLPLLKRSRTEGDQDVAQESHQRDEETHCSRSPAESSGSSATPTNRKSKLAAIIDRLKTRSEEDVASEKQYSRGSQGHEPVNATDQRLNAQAPTMSHSDVHPISVKLEIADTAENAEFSPSLDDSVPTETCNCLDNIQAAEADLAKVSVISACVPTNVVGAAHVQLLKDGIMRKRLEHAGHLAERALQLIPEHASTELYQAVVGLVEITRLRSAHAFAQ
ncbi:HAM-2 protein [Aphelenchoides avenae]|nr:HAM-2 protein [Aphelenchus avenae]